MKRLIGISFAGLFLIGPAHCATVNCVGTYNNIGIEVQTAQAETVKVEYKESTASAYKEGHFLTQIDANTHAGSLFMLKAGTSYDIRLKLNTGDQVVTASTRPDTFPGSSGSPGTVYHVSPNGNDNSNDGRSPATAYKTIGKAVSMAQAGNTVYIHTGNYREEITLPRSGTATAPIIIRNAPGEHPIMDGRDSTRYTNWTLYDAARKIYRTPTTATYCRDVFYRGNHIYPYYVAWYPDAAGCFADMLANPYSCDAYATVYNGYLYIRCPNGVPPTAGDSICLPARTKAIACSRNYIQIIGLEIGYYSQDDYSGAIMLNSASYNLIDSCYFHHNITGVQIKGASDFNTIQHVKNRETPIDQFPWSGVKDGAHHFEAGAVYVFNSDNGTTPNIGNVIRFNDFEHQFDCAHLFASPAAGATRNMDFHDNLCWYSGDDGIELDGYGVNVRIYNNHLKAGLTGISLAPTGTGPVYIFRNIISDWNSKDGYTGYPFKMNYGSDAIDNVFLYHNTCATTNPSQPAFWYKIENVNIVHKFTTKNNIFEGTDLGIRNDVLPTARVSMDYDDIYTTGSSYINWLGTGYSTIAAFSAATGLEAHGLNKVRPDFLDSPNNDYRLSAASPLIDKGVIIPGMNDDFTGTAPDIGRFEQGNPATVQSAELPDPVRLNSLHCHQNSFSSPATITLELAKKSSLAKNEKAALKVYDIQGALVCSSEIKLVNGSVNWRPNGLQPGRYIAKLSVSGTVFTALLILMK